MAGGICLIFGHFHLHKHHVCQSLTEIGRSNFTSCGLKYIFIYIQIALQDITKLTPLSSFRQSGQCSFKSIYSVTDLVP